MGKVLGYILLTIGVVAALSDITGLLQNPNMGALINNVLVIVIGIALVSLGLKQLKKA